MKKIFVFGDSHARYFEINKKVEFHAPWVSNYTIEVHKIPASSIIGLGRKRSKLNVKDKISEFLDRDAVNVFAFGQVDIELGYYYRKVVKSEKISPSEFVNMLTDQYKRFINKLDIPPENIVIKGLNLTVLKHQGFSYDYIKRIILENLDNKIEIVNMEKKLLNELDPFPVRNNTTILFNRSMEKISRDSGWKYFDINNQLSDFNPGKGITDRYIPSSFDHHVIDSIETRKLHLSKLIESL